MAAKRKNAAVKRRATPEDMQKRLDKQSADNDCLRSRVEELHREISKHMAAAAMWEVRFDRLLRVAAGESLPVSATYTVQT